MYQLKKAKTEEVTCLASPTASISDSLAFKGCRFVLKALDQNLPDDIVLHGLERLYGFNKARSVTFLLAGKVLMSKNLTKSHVTAYDRLSASGTLQHVTAHEDSRHSRPLKPGQMVYYKAPEGRKARQGHLIAPVKDGWSIQGKREAGKFKAPIHNIPHGDILTVEEQTSKYAPVEHRDGKFLSTEENNRRADVGYERLGLSEAAVLTSQSIEAIQNATLNKLAVQNQIRPFIDGIADDDYSEMWSHYMGAMITSSRHETSTASPEDIKQFKDHVLGKCADSRIVATITMAGRGAAIRYLKDRTKRNQELTDFQDMENDPALRREMKTTPPEHESETTRITVRNKLIDQFVSKLPAIEAEIIQRKYGLGEYDKPQSDEYVARVLNSAGLLIQVKAGQKHPHTGQIHPKDGVVRWTRNHVATANKTAIARLKDIHGLNALRQFVKSVKEVATLKKSCADGVNELQIVAEGILLQRKLRLRMQK